MTDQNLEQRTSGETKAEIVQATIRVVLALLILGGLIAVFTRIPGTDRVVLDPDITVASVLVSVLTLMIFGAILNYATVVGRSLARAFSEFAEIERIVQLVALLAIIVAAYRIFWWVPYFRANPFHYDVLFLSLGLLVSGWLGYLLYTNVDDLSRVFTDRLVSHERSADVAPEHPPGETRELSDSSTEEHHPDAYRTSGGTDTTAESISEEATGNTDTVHRGRGDNVE